MQYCTKLTQFKSSKHESGTYPQSVVVDVAAFERLATKLKRAMNIGKGDILLDFKLKNRRILSVPYLARAVVYTRKSNERKRICTMKGNF